MSKTSRTGVEGENTCLRHYRTVASQNVVLFQTRRNAETFKQIATSLLAILGCPNSCLITPTIEPHYQKTVEAAASERSCFFSFCWVENSRGKGLCDD